MPWPTKKLGEKNLDDIIFEKTYQKLSKVKNSIAIAYLFEIISLQLEYFCLESEYLEIKSKYSERKHRSTCEGKLIIDRYLIFVQNLIYRYYSLLEKLSQLINNIWIKEFSEEECNFVKVKKICKKNEKFNFVNKELKRLNVESIDKIIDERRKLVHRRIVNGKGSSFSPRILPLGGETAKEYSKWENESKKILNEAYKTTFKVIKNLLEIYINEN